jgi:heterodisulfide reductase subunit C
MVFDEAFAHQVFETGKIEEGLVLRQFLARTGQPLRQPWIVALIGGLVRRFPVFYLIRLGLAAVFRPRTRSWGKAQAAINEYVAEREAANRRALRLDANGADR